jgi:uncharacterized membrane protein YphA (DoxX/SURF4 family)
MEMVWYIVVRLVVGTYWIYFSVMKWFDRSWVNDLLSTAANGNYIPGYNQLLRYAASNSGSIAIVVTVLETVIGLLILLGILTRVGATLGALLGLNLLLSFVFCRCQWAQTDFALVFWFYFFPIILNLQVAFDKSSKAFGLQRIVKKYIFQAK